MSMARALSDYHVHLERGPYEKEWLDRFVSVALSRGVEQLGISEHGHRFRGYDAIMAHLGRGEGSFPHIAEWLSDKFRLEVSEYVSFVEQAKAEGYPVRLGIEVDYLPGYARAIEEWLAPWPWDYVIGSVHFIGKWGFDHGVDIGWPGRDVEATYQRYFELVADASRSGL